ncbi:MAG: hypothetical protein K2X81_12775 [Candidatus Obscuribacterales bacterium]|nr:hypothetical protein [Candidatus Obscuribacterales bacterium]
MLFGKKAAITLWVGLSIASGVPGVCSESKEAQKNDKAKTVDTSAKHAEEVVKGEAPAATPEQKKQAADTAAVMNKVPGVSVTKEDLTPPTLPPIRGFHPIKKALRPIEDMEAMVVKLQQQIMRLEGPISGLNPPMVSLQQKMSTTNDRINTMQNQLTSMEHQVTGVRSDLARMEKSISKLEGPITSLQKPISNVARPLEEVQKQLNMILAAIMFATLAIAIGTPVAALLIYVNRRKLFPKISEQEMPKVTPGKPAPVGR